MKWKILLTLVLMASVVYGQPVPGHRIYGYVTDQTGWGIVGARVSVTGNESGLVWEGTSRGGGYFNSGYMSYIGQGEELLAQTSWLGMPVNVSHRGLGARTLFELKVLVVVDRPRHRQQVRNVTGLPLFNASGRLGEEGNLTVSLENLGGQREIGVEVEVEGLPTGWSVSGTNLIDLERDGEGDMILTLSIPRDAAVGTYDLIVKIIFEGGVNYLPFVFTVEPACVVESECEVGFMCVNGVCEVDSRCFNNLKDHGEEGIDCGGPCTACIVTTVPRPRLTTIPSITTLPKTTSSTAPPIRLCFNGVWDVGEEGVDCGGTCPPCIKGKSLWGLFGGIAVFLILVLLLLAIILLWVIKRKKKTK